MKVKERLLECKVKTGIKSDYALADALGCSRQRISEVMSGKCKPDAYLAIKIADVLRLHPMMLIAEFEAESAKSEERRGFWLNFKQRIKGGALSILALIYIGTWSQESKATTLTLDTHNG